MKRIFSLVTLVLLGSTLGFANIARPQPTPNGKAKAGVDTVMAISLDHKAKEARLIIPRTQLKQLRAELERLEGGDDNTAVLTSEPGGSGRLQTIVSGMFLSLAFVFGGILLMRSRQTGARFAKPLMLLAVITAVGSATMLVYANAGPPPEARSITGKLFSPALHSYGFGWGKIRLEVGDEHDRVQLIVPNPRSETAPGSEE